jgi:hypothetical protein
MVMCNNVMNNNPPEIILEGPIIIFEIRNIFTVNAESGTRTGRSNDIFH